MVTGNSYYMRARDSGTGSLVYWFTDNPTVTPSASTTVPNYTGTLGTFFIVRTFVREVATVVSRQGGFVFQDFTTIPAVMPNFPPKVGNGLVGNVLDSIRHTIVFQNFKQAFDARNDTLVFSGSAVQVV